MEYYVFVRNHLGEERLVASSPSLEIARAAAKRMASSERVEGVVAAVICIEAVGQMKETEIYHRNK